MTANDILDHAGVLAVDAGWPTSAYAGKSVPMVAAMLKKLEAEGLVQKAGEEKVQGVYRPTWAIGAVTAAAHHDLPPPPEAERTKHVIDQWDPIQLAAVFDAQDDTIQLLLRQRREQNDMAMQHGEQFRDLIKRIGRDLHARGIEK